ncbi:MAG TPA: Ig-like domain-containing protein [Candidatus Limnocylindrales bacterium]
MRHARHPSRRVAVGSATAALLAIALVAGPASAGLLGIARDDRYSTAFETTLVVAEPGVLANDVDIGSNATAELTDDVAHGIVVLEEDGSFEYEPDDGFAGTDRFDYRVTNSVTGLLLSATVTITVAPAPATPTPAPTAPPTPAPTATPPPLPLPTLPPLPLPTIDPPLPTPDVPLPTPTIPLPSGSLRPGVSPTPSGSPDPRTSPSPASSPDVAAGGSTGTGPQGGGGLPGGGLGSGLDVVGAGDGADAGTGVSVDLDLGLPMTLFVPTLVLTVPGLLVMLAVLAQGLGALAWLPFVRRDLGDFGLVGRRRRDQRDRS